MQEGLKHGSSPHGMQEKFLRERKAITELGRMSDGATFSSTQNGLTVTLSQIAMSSKSHTLDGARSLSTFFLYFHVVNSRKKRSCWERIWET